MKSTVLLRTNGKTVKWPSTGTVCISEDGKCGNGVEIGRPGEGSGEDGNHGAPTN
ncbi:MAG: hypothetical protein V8T40_02590 [Phocaeicola vulgatus]